jgi:hypothetical protein
LLRGIGNPAAKPMAAGGAGDKSLKQDGKLDF